MRGRKRSLPVAFVLMLAAMLTFQAPALILSTTASQDSGEKIKLVYFNARGGEAAEQALIQKYMEENPNIEIEYLSTTAIGGPSDTDTIANLIFSLEAGTTIDVAKVEVQRTPLELMATGSNLELSEINPEGVQERSEQLLNMNTVQIKDGVWGLPYEYDPFGYIYNADMYAEAGLDPDSPPTTWDELREVNTALQETFPDAWAICHPLKNLNKIQPLVWGAGGTYWNDTVPPTESTVTDPATVEAYKFFDEWATEGWLNTEEISTDQSVQHMVSGQCAAVNISSSTVMLYAANAPDTDFRVAAYPTKDDSFEPVNFAGGSALVVPSTAAHPEEALDFMLWLTSAETQRLKFGVEGDLGVSEQDIFDQDLPTNKEVAAQLADDPVWEQAMATFDIPTQPAGGLSPVYSRAYEVLASMQEEIALTDVDVEEAVQQAQSDVQALIDQNMQEMPELYEEPAGGATPTG
jgi:multiple sugar transport system substrate-binding protein